MPGGRQRPRQETAPTSHRAGPGAAWSGMLTLKEPHPCRIAPVSVCGRGGGRDRRGLLRVRAAGRPWGLVGEVAAVVLEDEADRGEDGEHAPDQEEPPADREAGRGERGGEAQPERPPAVRAEEPDLAGALLDLARVVVLRALGQAAAGEQAVEAGEYSQPDRERERGGPGHLLGGVPVHDVRAGEEDAAAEEQPAFDLHLGKPTLASRWPRPGSSARLRARHGPT